ncbi:MAG: DUF1501 domain-containing protein [Chlorobi bacterium]|nr:DUF1501 domain-containing protein [Chlorobiota bacterium]
MNRRSLLKGLAATGVVAQLMPHVGIKAFAHALPRRGLLRTAAGNKNAMVILRLYGGNDGLNTLVPVHDENYYRFRHRGTNRNVSILPEETLLLPDHATLGLHPSLALLHELYQEGKMAAVQNVGYPNQDLSHFRSTDIWLTGSDAWTFETSGWYGRYLEDQFPDALNALPTYPFAIEMGPFMTAALMGRKGPMGFALNDLHYLPAPTGNSTGITISAEIETEYVRLIARQSHQFIGALMEANTKTTEPTVEYPSHPPLATELSTIAKLIDVGVETSVWLVTMPGFDTHHHQLPDHAARLAEIGRCIHTFQRDLESRGLADRVCLMVISEFGRRVESQGLGTDHGAAAPVMVVGNGVQPGIIGPDPDLVNLDENDNLRFQYDFRQIYSSLMCQWLGAEPESLVPNVFERTFAQVPIFKGAQVGLPIAAPLATSPAVQLEGIWPNPARSTAEIFIRGANGRSDLTVECWSQHGQLLLRQAVPANGILQLNVLGWPTGSYMLRLHGDEVEQSQKFGVVR